MKFNKGLLILLLTWVLNYLFFLDSVMAKTVHIKVSDAKDIGIKIILLPVNNFTKNNKYKDIMKIIANDLNYSGQFKILEHKLSDEELSKQIPGKVKNIDYKFWRNRGAEYLLITKLYPSNDVTKLIVNLQIIDLYNPLNPINLNKEIIKDPNESFRRLGHRLSGVVFDKLTGIKNFFNTKIAYVRVKNLGEPNTSYSLNIIDFDGHNEHQLFTTDYPIMSPSWSPDGRQIAFVSFYNNRSNISIADLPTGKISIISHYPGINGAPAWSPNGEKLAVVLSKDGAPRIYLLDLTTRNLHQLTSGMAIDTEPFWSEDSAEIFFTSNRGGKPQIYKVNINSGYITRITFKGQYNATPKLTPDNRYLVMLHCDENCSKNDPKFKIAVQSLDKGTVRVLTTLGMEESPSISPNGTMVVYSGKNTKDSNKVLATVSIEGYFNQEIPITNSASDNFKNPAWSPFLE